MATTTELINSLPPRLVYYGEVYNLNWSVSRYDRRCLQVCYRNAYDEVLYVGEDYFFVESEKHNAVYLMLRLILSYAEHILAHVYYEDQYLYERLLDNIYNNGILLQQYCSENQINCEMMNNNYSTIVM